MKMCNKTLCDDNNNIVSNLINLCDSAFLILCPCVLVISIFTVEPWAPPSSMLMVAESVHFWLKCNNMTRPVGLRREMPHLRWAVHMGLILLPPARCSSSASLKPKHRTAQRSSGDGKAWYSSWIPAQPHGDSWPVSLAQCFLHCLQHLFKSK